MTRAMFSAPVEIKGASVMPDIKEVNGEYLLPHIDKAYRWMMFTNIIAENNDFFVPMVSKDKKHWCIPFGVMDMDGEYVNPSDIAMEFNKIVEEQG